MTDQRPAAPPFSASEAWFRAILEHLPAACVVADGSGKVVLENSHVVEILGHSVLQLQSAADYARVGALSQDGRQLAVDEYPMRRALRGEQIDRADYVYERPDGHAVWLRVSAVPIITDGRIEGVVVLFANISGEKAAEAALEAAARDLREADQRKDRFLATLSHELRNPLGAIQFAVQLMKLKVNEPETVERSRSMIERQVKQVTHLIGDLLEVSRIAEDKLHLERERLDLRECVLAAVETVRSQYDARNQAVDVRGDTRPLVVVGDRNRLTQVVVNLLVNASKYSNERTTVTVEVSDGHHEAHVTVRDRGLGIPGDMLPHIFEPLRQVESHRENAAGGLGLGLSLVKRLVELHGGTVRAHSEGPGRGSEFTITLPIA
jgi:PAS domain S-box-containing protein